MNSTIVLDAVLSAFPNDISNIKKFESGAIMIDILLNGVAYVIEFLPSKGLGVSRRDTAVFGWEGVEKQFSSEDSLIIYLRSIASRDSSR